MENLDLNRNLEETKELHTRWSQFHDYFRMAIKGGKVTPQAEAKFLDVKTRIAMLHDGFMKSLRHDANVGQNVLEIIGQCIMLRRIPQLGQAEIQKLEFDWNECYLLMTETIANMEEEKEELADVSENAYKLGQARERITATLYNFFVGAYFKAIVILAVVGFATVGVPMFGIYDYMNIKKDLPWAAFAYDEVVPLIRKVNPELRFVTLADVPKTIQGGDVYPVRPEGLQNITAEWLKSQFPRLGFADATALKEGQKLFDARKSGAEGFERERRALMVYQSDILSAYYILFDTTEDAKRFVEIRRRSIDKFGPEMIEKFRLTQNVCRKANFVAIFLANEEGLRINYAKETYDFKEEQMNL